MGVKDEVVSQQQREGGASEQAKTGHADDRHAPRNLTFAENGALTVKVLLIAGLLIAALWGLSVWTSAN